MVDRDALCPKNFNMVDREALEDTTENCTLKPRKPMSEDYLGVLLGVALFLHHFNAEK